MGDFLDPKCRCTRRWLILRRKQTIVPWIGWMHKFCRKQLFSYQQKGLLYIYIYILSFQPILGFDFLDVLLLSSNWWTWSFPHSKHASRALREIYLLIPSPCIQIPTQEPLFSISCTSFIRQFTFTFFKLSQRHFPRPNGSSPRDHHRHQSIVEFSGCWAFGRYIHGGLSRVGDLPETNRPCVTERNTAVSTHLNVCLEVNPITPKRSPWTADFATNTVTVLKAEGFQNPACTR